MFRHGPPGATKMTEATMKLSAMLLASAVLLCGCSTTPTSWMKVGYSHAEFKTDWEECQKQEFPAECMTAKGYVPANQ